MPATLRYDKGTILISGGVSMPYGVWDKRVGCYRTEAHRYRDIVEYLNNSKIAFEDRVMDVLPFPLIKSGIELRDYQEQALRAWDAAGRRGVIVQPTGSGKTLLAVKAIEGLGQPSLIVVPTIDLLQQWKEVLEKTFGVPIGTIMGGVYDLQPITVSTYDSAYLKIPDIGNKFPFLVLDEVHHLGGEGYAQIAEMSAAPYRLGLTATIEREDMRHLEIFRLLGGVVYSTNPADLAGTYLAEYKLEKVFVELSKEEKERYKALMETFRGYLVSHNIYLTSAKDFRHFIMLAARDGDARAALVARNKALDIALNTPEKLGALERILKTASPSDKIIVFTQHNSLVHTISKKFLIPYITYRTDKEERQRILHNFKSEEYRAIVASKTLDEGLDVPEASLGILVSGSGSRREFIQRLGRLLRKREGKLARLVEIITKETYEVSSSRKRKRGV